MFFKEIWKVIVIVFFCIPCLILFGVMGILGIFFPKYRPYIKEAWQCFWRKLQFKPCDSPFDQKVKAKITGYFIKKNYMRLAKFNQKYFEVMMTLFGIVFFIVSIYLTYLFIVWIILGQSPCVNGGTVVKLFLIRITDKEAVVHPI